MNLSEPVLAIVLACIGSSGLTSLIQFLINRKDKISEKQDAAIKELKCIKDLCNSHEKAICRSQLLLLISSYPEEKKEIMKLAEYYFEKLDGNWYMSSIFNKWLTDNNLAKPDWFNATE